MEPDNNGNTKVDYGMTPELLRWWIASRDRLILGAFLLMFLFGLFWFPSTLTAMREEHQRLIDVIRVMCVHAADTKVGVTECMFPTVLTDKPVSVVVQQQADRKGLD